MTMIIVANLGFSRTEHILPARPLTLSKIKIMDKSTLSLLFADQHPIKMHNFLQLRIHRIIQSNHPFEQLLVFLMVFLVVIGKVHGFLYFDSMLKKKDLKFIEVYKPLVRVLYGSVIMLFSHCTFKEKTIHTIKGRKVAVGKLHGKILVTIDTATILLLDTFQLDRLYDCLAVRNGSYKGSIYEEVGKYVLDPLMHAILGSENIVEAKLRKRCHNRSA